MAGQKALRVSTAISRLLPNTGGPRQAARKLLAAVSTSTMMYGAPIWYTAVGIVSYMRVIVAAHRISSWRVCCAFRTISSDAVCVVAGRSPPQLLAKKAAAIRHLRVNGLANRENLAPVEATQLANWQRMWDESPSGR